MQNVDKECGIIIGKMLNFSDFLFESLLTEVLDSDFTINRNEGIQRVINNQLGSKVFPGHTAVMSSEHMQRHGLHVLRLKNRNHEVEYHLINFTHEAGRLPPEQQNSRALMHGLKIIKDDAERYASSGHKIKLQAATDSQHQVYKKLATHLVKNHPGKTVRDAGEQERIDGQGTSKTLMIEATGFNPINWLNIINSSQ